MKTGIKSAMAGACALAVAGGPALAIRSPERQQRVDARHPLALRRKR
jgi:hypothetical protein